MRMRDLERRSGLPRSTIHYYVREGLLPPPERPSPNSAIYSERHAALLEQLARLRTPPLGPMPLPMMKRVVSRLKDGVSIEMALSLEKAVAGVVDPQGLSSRLNRTQLCKAAGMSRKRLGELIDAGAIVPDPTDGQFDSMDLELARIYQELLSVTGMKPSDTKPIADRIRKESRYEMDLRNKAIKGKNADEASQITLLMEQSIHAIRNYLYYRARLVELSEGE